MDHPPITPDDDPIGAVPGTEASIVRDPSILGGTPIVRGTRVTVYALLGRVRGGETPAEIAADDPLLTPASVRAAVAYAERHPLSTEGRRPWAGGAVLTRSA